MKIAETYGKTQFLSWSLKTFLVLVQSATYVRSLRDVCSSGGSRFKISDDTLHSNYIETLVELIPFVDLETQLLAVELLFNIAGRDIDASDAILELLDSNSNYDKSHDQTLRSFGGEDTERNCDGRLTARPAVVADFVRQLHASNRLGRAMIHAMIWDVLASIGDSTNQTDILAADGADNDASDGDDDDAMEAFDQDAADTDAASSALDAALGLDDADDDEPEDMIVMVSMIDGRDRRSRDHQQGEHLARGCKAPAPALQLSGLRPALQLSGSGSLPLDRGVRQPLSDVGRVLGALWSTV